MAIIKCKMCGGDLELVEGTKVCECEYCGTKQTVPDTNDEKRLNLYNRANRLRIACEFDKAAGIYESIISEFPEEAEAYWGLCLSTYGIEYVDDPATARKVPTCHRASFDKMRKDVNYELALENADMASRMVYEDQAKEIDRIMGEILAVSRAEEPYDIFICYKEADRSGARTPDSVLAQDIYDALTAKGYRVFFSRITLEDKLGAQYEPYIFSALQSAKVMLVVGTDYEYLNAVWVKNEWSRFLKLSAKDKTRVLIPCYKDMDPYDMPDELQGLQSQDCGKLGFLQDLTRGIDKLFGKTGEHQPAAQPVVVQSAGGVNLTAQIKRGIQALEDGDWDAADGFFDKALDIDAECAEAFFGKALAAAKCATRDALVEQRLAIRGTSEKRLTACEKESARISEAVNAYTVPGYLSAEEISGCFKFDDRDYVSQTEAKEKRLEEEKAYWEKNRHLNRALRYSTGDFSGTLNSLRERINEALIRDLEQSREKDAQEKERVAARYAERMEQAEQDAKKLYEDALEKREADYIQACEAQEKAVSEIDYRYVAVMLFGCEKMRGYKDSADRAKQCMEKVKHLKEEEQKQKKEAEYLRCCQAQEQADSIAAYSSAASGFENESMRDYKDSAERAKHCRAEEARLREEERRKKQEADYVRCCEMQEKAHSAASLSAAAELFSQDRMRDYKDSAERARQCRAEAARLKQREKQEAAYIRYCEAQEKANSVASFSAAAAFFEREDIRDYKDSAERAKQCWAEADRLQEIVNHIQAERAALQTELKNLKGFFTGKRRREIEARLAELEKELKNL